MLVKIHPLTSKANGKLLHNLIGTSTNFIVRGSAVIFDFHGQKVYTDLWTGHKPNIQQQALTKEDREEYYKIA